MEPLKKIGFLVLICIISLIGMSQEEKKDITSKHRFGVNTGLTNGFGFSYSFMSNKFGVDLTFIPIYSQKQKLFLCQGIALNFIIRQKELSDQFVYIGNGLVFSREHISYSHVTGPNQQITYVDYISKKYLYRAGGGWGIRLKGKNKLDWTFKVGVMWYSNWRNSHGVLPSAGLAVHYKL